MLIPSGPFALARCPKCAAVSSNILTYTVSSYLCCCWSGSGVLQNAALPKGLSSTSCSWAHQTAWFMPSSSAWALASSHLGTRSAGVRRTWLGKNEQHLPVYAPLTRSFVRQALCDQQLSNSHSKDGIHGIYLSPSLLLLYLHGLACLRCLLLAGSLGGCLLRIPLLLQPKRCAGQFVQGSSTSSKAFWITQGNAQGLRTEWSCATNSIMAPTLACLYA